MKQQLLLFFVGFSLYGQQVHHQMLSSQGSSNVLPSGTLVSQTIGQQSVIGNYKVSNSIIGQGFQQSLIAQSGLSSVSNFISTTTYPNPFVDQINFQFSSPVSGLITVTVFDLLGRQVFKAQKEALKNTITIDNLYFTENEYLVKLTAKNYNYSTQIIKTK